MAGAVIIAPSDMWNILFDLYRQATISLAQCGFSDDDQTLAVMAYRNYPTLFEIHPIDDMFSSFDVFNQKLSKHKTKQYKKVRKEAQRLLYKR